MRKELREKIAGVFLSKDSNLGIRSFIKYGLGRRLIRLGGKFMLSRTDEDRDKFIEEFKKCVCDFYKECIDDFE